MRGPTIHDNIITPRFDRPIYLATGYHRHVGPDGYNDVLQHKHDGPPDHYHIVKHPYLDVGAFVDPDHYGPARYPVRRTDRRGTDK